MLSTYYITSLPEESPRILGAEVLGYQNKANVFSPKMLKGGQGGRMDVNYLPKIGNLKLIIKRCEENHPYCYAARDFPHFVIPLDDKHIHPETPPASGYDTVSRLEWK